MVTQRVATLLAKKLTARHTPDRMAPAMVTERHPHLLTKAEAMGPETQTNPATVEAPGAKQAAALCTGLCTYRSKG